MQRVYILANAVSQRRIRLRSTPKASQEIPDLPLPHLQLFLLVCNAVFFSKCKPDLKLVLFFNFLQVN